MRHDDNLNMMANINMIKHAIKHSGKHTYIKDRIQMIVKYLNVRRNNYNSFQKYIKR